MAKQRTEIEYVWQDKKRIMGMPITFTNYRLSEDRLFVETGLLTSKYDEILLYRIRDIGLMRTLWQKLFGVGTIIVQSSDKTMPNLLICNVKHPMWVKEQLHALVEENKLRRRMRVSEWMGDADLADDDDDAPNE